MNTNEIIKSKYMATHAWFAGYNRDYPSPKDWQLEILKQAVIGRAQPEDQANRVDWELEILLECEKNGVYFLFGLEDPDSVMTAFGISIDGYTYLFFPNKYQGRDSFMHRVAHIMRLPYNTR